MLFFWTFLYLKTQKRQNKQNFSLNLFLFLSQAVCCTDGAHCCPANYKCDVTKVSCIKGDVVIPWYNKISAQSTPAPSLDFGAVECDEQSSCPADSTCCYLSTGEWGCCPLPEVRICVCGLATENLFTFNIFNTPLICNRLFAAQTSSTAVPKATGVICVDAPALKPPGCMWK